MKTGEEFLSFDLCNKSLNENKSRWAKYKVLNAKCALEQKKKGWTDTNALKDTKVYWMQRALNAKLEVELFELKYPFIEYCYN